MGNKLSRISKSQYLKGIQCKKALWFYRHRPDLMPEPSPSQQHLFDTGHEVGELAKTYFKNGIEIFEEYYQVDSAISSTQKAVADGRGVIFEATAASSDGAYSRIDIFKKKDGSSFWDLIEVKSSTSVKDYHIDDISFQRYAFISAGYKIKKTILMHIDNSYIRSGDIDVTKLFKLEDCTDFAKEKVPQIKETVNQLIKVINENDEPKIDIGDQCYTPFPCDYIGHCWKHIPNYSVYNVFRGEKLNEFLSNNIIEISDVPDDVETTYRKLIEIKSYKSNQIHVDKNAIGQFLKQLAYPLYFLDYETINPAVPLFDNTRPYQQIPFQFSLHVQRNKGEPLEHFEYLHTGPGDPRIDFIDALIGSCGKKGSVVVYNKAFESGRNHELAQAFPQYRKGLYQISERMIDLLVPFRSRSLYHSEMRGSASLKSVLPAFVPDMSYDDLEINDGGMASQMYLTCLKGNLAEDQKGAIFDALRKYCCQDTLAEVRLLEILFQNT